MSRSQGFLQYIAAVLLLALCSIKQVSSIKCYACHSDIDSDCIATPNQEKFLVECSSYSSYANTTNGFFLPQNIEDNSGRKIVEFDCAAAKGISVIDGRTVVTRGCAIKPVTCQTYKMIFVIGDGKGNGFQVDTCNRCGSNYCNYY